MTSLDSLLHYNIQLHLTVALKFAIGSKQQHKIKTLKVPINLKNEFLINDFAIFLYQQLIKFDTNFIFS